MALTKAHNRMIAGEVFNVKDFGAVGDGVTDDTDAIQAALDAINNNATNLEDATVVVSKKLVFEPLTYIITRPLEIKGWGLMIDGQFCTIRKTTNNTPSPALSSTQAVLGGNIDNNVNSIFLVKELTSGILFSTIENFNLEGVSGTSSPTGIYWWGSRNVFSNIRMSFVNRGLETPTGFLTKYDHIMLNNCASHGFYHNANRLGGARFQSGTSMHFTNCGVLIAGGKGYYLDYVSYASFDACASDYTEEEAYYFNTCAGLAGNIAYENQLPTATTPAISIYNNSNGSIVLDSYSPQALSQEAIKIYASKMQISGNLRCNNTVFVDAESDAALDLTGLQFVPFSGNEIDDARVVTSTGSYVYYKPKSDINSQRPLYTFSDYGMTLSTDGSEYLVSGGTGGLTPGFIYGQNKLRVVYDVTDFDTTYSDEIVVPLDEIRKVIPRFDDATWAQTPLALRIVERGNVAVGDWVSIQSGAIVASGQRAYTTIGTASKVLVSSIAIASGNLVITLDASGGTRQRVSCEITPLT